MIIINYNNYNNKNKESTTLLHKKEKHIYVFSLSFISMTFLEKKIL
jgi:hypothetical protein